jgi:hypothetical protein
VTGAAGCAIHPVDRSRLDMLADGTDRMLDTSSQGAR